MRIPLAIVGNGGAAAEAVIALRAHAYPAEIHLFADNQSAPYNPMLGTYVISGAIPLDRAFPFGGGLGFYEAHGVAAHLGKAVTVLDAAEQNLTTSDGSSYDYDRCLVATGARPSVPAVPGLSEALAVDDGRRVFTLRSLDDALGIKEAVERLRSRPGGPARVAVVGASFVGVKVASLVHDMGMQVCLVEREPHILPFSAHSECARSMEAHLLEEGYELRLGAALTGVHTGTDGVRLDFGSSPGAGETAREESPAHEEADLVVVCTGVQASLDFLVPGQVDTAEGILVDEHMRSSIPGLYAAGDAAQGKNLLSGRHEMIGLWASARYQGRAAGRSLAGAPAGYRGGVPHNITHVGRMLFASVGCVNDYDRTTVLRDGDSLLMRVWQGERLVGVNLLDCCLNAGALKQALLKVATGAATDTEATWTSFNG